MIKGVALGRATQRCSMPGRFAGRRPHRPSCLPFCGAQCVLASLPACGPCRPDRIRALQRAHQCAWIQANRDSPRGAVRPLRRGVQLCSAATGTTFGLGIGESAANLIVCGWTITLSLSGLPMSHGIRAPGPSQPPLMRSSSFRKRRVRASGKRLKRTQRVPCRPIFQKPLGGLPFRNLRRRPPRSCVGQHRDVNAACPAATRDHPVSPRGLGQSGPTGRSQYCLASDTMPLRDFITEDNDTALAVARCPPMSLVS